MTFGGNKIRRVSRIKQVLDFTKFDWEISQTDSFKDFRPWSKGKAEDVQFQNLTETRAGVCLKSKNHLKKLGIHDVSYSAPHPL